MNFEFSDRILTPQNGLYQLLEILVRAAQKLFRQEAP